MPRISINDDARAEGEALARNLIPLREEWLEAALPLVGTLFEDVGYSLPRVKVSCSFPGGGSAKRRIGECWPTSASQAGLNEVFISPYLDDPFQVIDVLVHELCHAVDDCASGHGKAFKGIATAVGLEGKMKQASAGPELRPVLEHMLEHLGPYPHVKLVPTERHRLSTPAVKFTCADEGCGLSFSLSQKKCDSFAIDHCPSCGGAVDRV